MGVDENGCKKFPCGILKCENKGECAADKDCCSSEDSCIKPRGANFKQCIGKGDKPGFLKSEVFCKCQGAKPDAVCCAANTPDCVGCSNGCTGDEFCRENPDNKVCKKKPETKCNGAPPGTKCCKESTKECVSCFKGCTADEFCAENPDSKLCSACGGKCGGQCIKEGDIAGFCQDDGKTCGISKPTCKKTKCNGKSPGTVCCNEPTAECVSCKAGCTAKEFCAENDNPDSKLCKNTKKCNGAPPGTACCKALSPSCLGCTKGCSGEEFCAENSDNKVCKKKPCPTASCEEPKDGCKYVPSDKVDEDGCKKFPCGILKSKDKCPVVVCLSPKAGCKYVASDDVDENGCKKHLCGILKCEKTCKNSPKQTCRKKCPANFCPSGQCSMRSGNCCDLKCMKEYNCNTREVWTAEKKAFCKKPCPTASCEAPKDGCKYMPSDKVDENGCKKFPCGILKCENKGECAADKDCCSSEDSCIKPRGANFKQCIGKGDKPGFLKSEVFCKCQGAKPDAVCCAANTPDCVGCSNGCTGDEFCRENPDNKVCKKKPETKCNGAPPGTKCCKESTKECVSCFKGCTA